LNGIWVNPKQTFIKNILNLIFDVPDYVRSWMFGTKEIEKEIWRDEENMALSMANLMVQYDRRL